MAEHLGLTALLARARVLTGIPEVSIESVRGRSTEHTKLWQVLGRGALFFMAKLAGARPHRGSYTMLAVLEQLRREIALSTIYDYSGLLEAIAIAQIAGLYAETVYWDAISRVEALEVAQEWVQ